MEENQKEEIKTEEEINNTKEEKQSNNSNEIKKETEKTIKEVKETIKNTDFKKESKIAKAFLTDFFKNPIGEIKKVASEYKNKFVKTAIIILIIWIIAIFLKDIIYIINHYLFGYSGNFKYLFLNLLDIVKDLIAPIISVGVLSSIVYAFKKNKDKSFLNIANTILIAKIPVVIASIFSLLTIIDTQITKITSLFSGFCNILSTVLLFFAIKELSDEKENENYFWKFALIIGIFYVAKLVISYLGISL